MDELLARMRAVSRRTGADADTPQFRLGDLVVDLAAKRVIRNGADDGAADIRLTPTEWHLLEVLLRNPGKLLSQQLLLAEVWGPGYADATRQPPPVHGAAAPEAGARSGPSALAADQAAMGYRYQPDPDVA